MQHPVALQASTIITLCARLFAVLFLTAKNTSGGVGTAYDYALSVYGREASPNSSCMGGPRLWVEARPRAVRGVACPASSWGAWAC